MARPATARPLTELLTTATRLVKQVTVDDSIEPESRSQILVHLHGITNILQSELSRQMAGKKAKRKRS